MSNWYLGPLNIYRLGAGVALIHPLGSLLVDCGDGVLQRWSEFKLPELGPDAVLFTSGAPGRIAGVYGLLSAFRGIQRTNGLELIHILGEEKLPTLVAAWQQNEGHTSVGAPIHLEGTRPGRKFQLGPFTCQGVPMRGEPMEAVWRISIGDTSIVVVGDTADSKRLSHACRNADAVITPWGVTRPDGELI